MSGAASAATLDADDITVSYVGGFNPSFADTTFTVGTGVEFEVTFMTSQSVLSYDLGGNTITVSFASPPPGNLLFGTMGYEVSFSGIDFGRGIGGVTPVLTQAVGRFGKGFPDVVTFTSDSVNINLRGFWEDGDVLTVTLSEAAEMPVIPLPASLPLALVGVAGLWGLSRRRRAAR